MTELLNAYDPTRFAPRGMSVPPDFTHEGWDFLFEEEDDNFGWVAKPEGAPDSEYEWNEWDLATRSSLATAQLDVNLRLLESLPCHLRDRAIKVMRDRLSNWCRDHAVRYWQAAESLSDSPLAEIAGWRDAGPIGHGLDSLIQELRTYVEKHPPLEPQGLDSLADPRWNDEDAEESRLYLEAVSPFLLEPSPPKSDRSL